jgi:hypothetical protein
VLEIRLREKTTVFPIIVNMTGICRRDRSDQDCDPSHAVGLNDVRKACPAAIALGADWEFHYGVLRSRTSKPLTVAQPSVAPHVHIPKSVTSRPSSIRDLQTFHARTGWSRLSK